VNSSEAIVLVHHRDGVATIELNRPARKNGLTSELVEMLIAALGQSARDPGVRVVVLTGSGGSFCSGMDLAEPPRPDELTFMRRVAALCSSLHDLPKPTIAKVGGPAYGFGANLALCCDLVLAGAGAVFGEIFTERGLSVDGGGSWSLPRLVGIAKAKEILFFGQRLSGAEAEQLGLANRSVPDDELDALCADWADRLAAGPPRALSVIKSALNTSFESSFAQAVEAEAIAQALSFRSEEVREGMRAFVERRPPRFGPG
jgi:2-(1,2-epoxy-1,2-dihydrophenyl)acetyl-CoA isomerase